MKHYQSRNTMQKRIEVKSGAKLEINNNSNYNPRQCIAQCNKAKQGHKHCYSAANTCFTN